MKRRGEGHGRGERGGGGGREGIGPIHAQLASKLSSRSPRHAGKATANKQREKKILGNIILKNSAGSKGRKVAKRLCAIVHSRRAGGRATKDYSQKIIPTWL